MKVLFTFGGLPHYYNYVLNRLNNINGLEIIVAAPIEKGETIGKGVHQKIEGIDFKLINVEEFKTYYGKPFLKDFSKIITEEKPEIIVTIWPYILAFIFNPFLYLKIKQNGIKLIFKDIPFLLPKFNDAVKYYFEQGYLTEDFNQKNASKFSKIVKYTFLKYTRWLYYKVIDAHVDYIEDAYEILPTYGVDPKYNFYHI